MKRKIVRLQGFLTVILLILCSIALFGCGGGEPQAPAVSNVTITAVDDNAYGKVGALHEIHYTAPDGCEISTSVKHGDAAATIADYSYSEDGIIFYTAGEYTVTVYASKGGMVGSASAKITIGESTVSVSDIKISAAAGETYGKVGAMHVISYKATAGSTVEVSIQRGGAPAENVVFDPQYNTVIFGAAGQYTVKVTASVDSAIDDAEAQIEIEITDEPTVTLVLDRTTVEEDEEVMLEVETAYFGGDTCEQESVSVLYRATSSDSFGEADESAYTLNGVRFTPHLAGEWRLTYTAEGTRGAVGEASVTLKCDPAQVALFSKTEKRHRIQTQTATEIDYLIEGAAEKYDVTFDMNGTSGVDAERGDGHSVRITASGVNYFTVTVVYTHKVDQSLQKKLDIDVYSVESLTYAPVWGDDPFDGMPSDVLTSMGHLLYIDATSSGGLERELTVKDAKFEVIEHRVTASSGSNSVEILNAAGDENYPYVIVANFDNNVATGDFTLKMTLTDAYTGYSAVATKKFNVLPTTNSNTNAAKFIENYVKEHADFYQMGSMDYTNVCSDCRHNMVLTKTGTIMQRTNPSWTLNNNNADFAQMDFATAAANCRLEFKFQLLAPNPVSGEAWLGIGVRTSVQTGWAGFFDLHIVGGKLDVTNGLDQRPSTEHTSAVERPLAQNGATLYVRIDRRVNGSTAEYTVYAKTVESAPYEQYYRCTYAVSAAANNPGAPVKQYQFTHRNAGGCYAVESVTVTSYDA